jgi:hypothetical protein
MDLSRPARLFAFIFNRGAPVTPAGVVRLLADYTIGEPDAVAGDVTLLAQVTIPDLLPTSQLIRVEILRSGQPFFPAHAFTRDSVVGLRFARSGALPSDTWAGSLSMVDVLRIEYTETCLFGGCL